MAAASAVLLQDREKSRSERVYSRFKESLSEFIQNCTHLDNVNASIFMKDTQRKLI